MIPGQPHLDFTEALLEFKTALVIVLIVIAALFLCVVANELGEWLRRSVLWYRLHNVASDFKQWRDACKCSRRIDKHLRSCGFKEVSPGRWERRQ
jgi:hypothetical protein